MDEIEGDQYIVQSSRRTTDGNCTSIECIFKINVPNKVVGDHIVASENEARFD